MEENKDSDPNIVEVLDTFINKIHHQRGIMLGMSFSALILAPVAIAISLYLLTHPRFLHIIQNETEFGTALEFLLTAIMITSGIWLVTGFRQYRSLSNWNKRYEKYMQKTKELDDFISSKFNLDKE